MSLESFLGFEQQGPMSESAFEAFKERMAAAAAQIAAIKKEEGKQKKKEEELVKILLKFIKTSKNKELTLLISRALEQNIPPYFVLTIILLNNKDIQEQTNTLLALKAAESNEKALVFFNRDDETLPLKVRIELDNWLKMLMLRAGEIPEKLIKNAYKVEFDEEKEIKTVKVILIQIIAFVINDFLKQNNINEDYKKTRNFAEFLIKGILTKTEENFKKRKMLE